MPESRPRRTSHAFLAVMHAIAGEVIAVADTGAAERGDVAELLPLKVAEIRRLLAALVRRLADDPSVVLAWSGWRRRHQARARISSSFSPTSAPACPRLPPRWSTA
jgi:hypothetical protein